MEFSRDRIFRSFRCTTYCSNLYIIVCSRLKTRQEEGVIVCYNRCPDRIRALLVLYNPSGFFALRYPCQNSRVRSSETINSRYVLRLLTIRDIHDLDIIDTARVVGRSSSVPNECQTKSFIRNRIQFRLIVRHRTITVCIGRQLMEVSHTIHIPQIQGTVSSTLHLCPETDLQELERINEFRQYSICIRICRGAEVHRLVTLVYVCVRGADGLIHHMRISVRGCTTVLPTYRSNTYSVISDTIVCLEVYDIITLLSNRVRLAKRSNGNRSRVLADSR